MFGCKKRYEINVILPEALEEKVQQVVEAYQAIEEAQTGFIDTSELDKTLLDAEVVVLGHLKARVSTVTRNLDKLQQERASNFENGLDSLASSVGNRIAEAEKDLEDLTSQMASCVDNIRRYRDKAT